MELFYSRDISAGCCSLDEEESRHCVKVLRHVQGDVIHIVDGFGSVYECRISNPCPKAVEYEILSQTEDYGSHPYHLHMAVCPPKNIDRFEWFAEKATEIAIDELTPLFGDYSERKVFKKERCERILISAAKQSHKGAIPVLNEACSVKDFLQQTFLDETAKYICYCDETESINVPKLSIVDSLKSSACSNYVIMIGPEGDFSREEIAVAGSNGWQPISLGESRLRIETAALTAVAAVYLYHIS